MHKNIHSFTGKGINIPVSSVDYISVISINIFSHNELTLYDWKYWSIFGPAGIWM